MSKDYPPYLDYPKHRSMNDKEKAFWVKEPDLVEVVRCKDCKHSDDDDCDAIYCVKWDKWQMPEDFFCGYGKRRTDV